MPPHLDPDDLKLIEDCKVDNGVLVTDDRVLREAAGGLTAHEVLEMAERKAPPDSPPEAMAELKRLRRLSPEQLSRLANAGDRTSRWFLKHIIIGDTTSALLVRQLRVQEEYSWRAVARAVGIAFGGDWGSNQLAGVVICKKAAELLGENFLEPPWN